LGETKFDLRVSRRGSFFLFALVSGFVAIQA
jgi:hypothetical protein